MAIYKYDGKQWIGYNEYDTALEIVQKSKNNILYLESLHDSGMVEEQLQQIRSQLNEIRTELSSLEMRTDSIEETLPLKQDELSAGLAIGIYGTTIAVKLQDIAAKLDSVPTGAAITSSSADFIRVENKLYYKTETSVGGMSTYTYEELTNSELTERIVAQIPTGFKIDDTGRLILVHDSNVIGTGVEIGGVGVTIDAPATATQGTLTATQLGILEASETNYIMFNHEKYYLMDKQHTSGSLTYSHIGADNQINHIKTFTITLSNLTWVLIDTEVGKSEPAITIVDELPEANEENFEKGKIYTTGELLKYISKVALSEPNISQIASLPFNTQNSAAVKVGNVIYVVYQKLIYKYDINTNSYTLLPIELQSTKSGGAIAYYNNCLYAVHGSIEKVNLTTNTVEQLIPTFGTTHAAFCVVDNKFYAFGGYNSQKAEVFNMETETVSTLPDIDTIRAGAKAVNGHNGYIYIFGGWNGAYDVVSGVLKWSIANSNYTKLSISIPDNANFRIPFYTSGKIYLIGGTTSKDSYSYTQNKISVFDISQQTCTQITQTLEVSFGAYAQDVDKVYIFGGAIKSSSATSQARTFGFGYIFQYKTIATS